MEATLSWRLDFDDNLLKQRAKSRLLGKPRMDLTCLGEDGQAPRNPFCSLEQSNRMLQNFLSIVGGKQCQADRHG